MVGTAVKFAKLAGDASADVSLESLIERQLGNADKALGNTATERGARRVVTNYDLSLVNTESRFEVPKIVEALRRRRAARRGRLAAPGCHPQHQVGYVTS